MELLQLDVAFPMIVLAAGAAGIAMLRTLELAARGWVRRQTLAAISVAPTLSEADGTRHAGIAHDGGRVVLGPSSPLGVGQPQGRRSAD